MTTNNNYNPDVLTCLANLSSDEVFTSPQLANQMLDLLPKEIWRDKNARFLDPVCKSGVFLREIAKRLDIGLEKEIPNKQKRINHIFKNQIFGIAITELTSLLSRRSVYCSKTANGKYSVCEAFDTDKGNILFGKIKHAWVNGRCHFCGASQEIYDRDDILETYAYQFIHVREPEVLFKMKFDVIVGNPPYQLSDEGAQASASPLYHKFVQQAKKLNPRYLTMIIPSRWFAGGKGLDDFRDEMLKDDRIREIHDFMSASDCFSGVEIKGGVCYFLWDRDNRGLCKVFTHEGDKIISAVERPLLEKHADIFVRHNEAMPILHKVLEKGEESFSKQVSARKPFGLPTNFNDFTANKFKDAIKIYANQKTGYIKLEQVRRNEEWIDKYKVYIPKATGIGNVKKDWLNPILGGPGTCCTETYVVAGVYSSKKKAENVVSYVQTKFFHFLLSLRKITQDTTSKVYTFIPVQNYDEPWTDEKLYKKYGLSKKEKDYIESMVCSEGGDDE